jgi:3'-5' exonuclease
MNKIFPVESSKMLFFDIETCGLTEKDSELPVGLKEFCKEYEDYLLKRSQLEYGQLIDDIYLSVAGLIPELGRVIVASFGWVKDGSFVTKSLSNIHEIRDLLDLFFDKGYYLCGHNIKNFDIPYIAKKCLGNGIKPPKFAPVFDQKPWELKIVDTNQFYKFGNNSSMSSISIITEALNIPTPKNGNVTGKNMHNFFYSDTENKMEEIKKYCEKDVEVVYSIINKIENLK